MHKYHFLQYQKIELLPKKDNTQRYTKEFVANSDTFSLTFFDKNFKKELGYLGTISGKDEDKISKANLTIKHSDSTPYFDEANITIICHKLYAQDIKPECFISSEIDISMYPEKDYHTIYIAIFQVDLHYIYAIAK